MKSILKALSILSLVACAVLGLALLWDDGQLFGKRSYVEVPQEDA